MTVMKIRNYIIILSLLSFGLSNYVFWEPEIPVPGGEITIYYNTIDGSLPNSTFPVYVHLGNDGWQDVEDYAMSYSPINGVGWWKYSHQIPDDAETIDFVFTDLNDSWDNNGGVGIDWHISLNYYWAPFNPTPNDSFDIILNNVEQSGSLVWTVDSGNGHEQPISDYWPEGSFIQDGVVVSPLESLTSSSLSLTFNPFQSGEQVVSSLKFKILWEDGTYDAGENGQIIYYDVYFDYASNDLDPEITFTAPQNNEIINGDVNISFESDADLVELWLNGNLLTTLNGPIFDYVWQPDSGVFGDIQIVAKAVLNDRVTFSFLDFYLEYQLNQLVAPQNIKDGVNIIGNDVVIALYAPNKDYVSIKGSWNEQFPNGEIMNLSGDTLWWYQTTLPDGDYFYQYNLEGMKYIADPWSHDVEWKEPFTGNESSNFQHAKTKFSIGSTAYEWNDESYIRPEVKDLVIYEMHIGDYSGDEFNFGDFSDVIEKINSGYFTDLGINAIEFMPVNEFEGSYSWGYDPVFPMAPESSYGTPSQFKNLVDIAHQNGIAILLDVVFNHLWGSSPLFQLYQPLNSFDWEDHNFDLCPYFGNEESIWGYKIEHWHELDGRQYRGWKYVEDSIIHWVEEYHVDGYRFDYVDGIGWDGDFNGASYYANILDNHDPSLILIAETDNPYQMNNTDFDSGWDYSYHHNMFDNVLDIYFDLNTVSNHINAYSQGYSFVTGPINYTESHDETRLVYQATEFQNQSFEEAYNRSKLSATILFTSHGVPMIYAGQELGQCAATRDSGGYPVQQPIQWDNLEVDLVQDLNNHYKKMIDLRKNTSVLKEPPLEVKYLDNNYKCFIYWRADQNEKVVVAINFDTSEKFLDLEFPHSGDWTDVVSNSQISIDSNWYGGFNLAPLTSYVFVPSALCTQGDLNSDGIVNIVDIISLVNIVLNQESLDDFQSCAGDLSGDGVINIVDIISLVNVILSE
tara:strand:- start:1923 stop:4817 length:2895 start_codon:yes stop_codon:yes gene_type:complete